MAAQYAFQKAELSPNGKIYTSITGVDIDQPTEKEALNGTKSMPIGQSVGSMGLGEGTITFGDYGELVAFIDDLASSAGDLGYREVTWPISWVLTKVGGGDEIKIECFECSLTSEPISHESGSANLGGEVNFVFERYEINGNSPHSL